MRVRVREADRVRPWAAGRKERRMLHLITRGPRYTASQARRLSSLVSRMRGCYSTLILTHGLHTYRGERDITTLMRTSRDPDLLLWAWVAWHNALGPPIRPLFTQAVTIMNQAARMGGYEDMGAAWRSELEFDQDADVWAAVDQVYNQVSHLYTLLHAHVRDALIRQYGKELVDPAKPIPAHLAGDLWGQDWSSMLELILPDHHDHTLVNVTGSNRGTNVTTREMVKEVDKFYQGLGFPPLTEKFWSKSVLGEDEWPGRGACHPRSLDMFSPGDYRMMMCETGGEEGVHVAYHELGHVHYFQAYTTQPAVFRDGVNSAFHETVGDTVHLAAMSSSSHVTSRHNTVTPINRKVLRELLQVALTKLPLLAFARVVDEWRWRVFQGTVREEEYNTAWWLLKLRYQGLAPPTPRSEHYFDPAAKFHVPDNTPYVRYLVAVVAQFQVHRGLCEKAQGRPLLTPPHTCTIAGSHAAGNLLRRVMAAGSSVGWRELLQELTNNTHLDAEPLITYLAPLTRWLHEQALTRNLTLGW
ncbi:angiotensin-converting enzyme-like [Homarus americanus]|nr:angiotensin-converting enzyme-like [Homarus americanus]